MTECGLASGLPGSIDIYHASSTPKPFTGKRALLVLENMLPGKQIDLLAEFKHRDASDIRALLPRGRPGSQDISFSAARAAK